MEDKFTALDKYIWITEQLKENGKFNLHEYCNKFHSNRYGKTKFPARDATVKIDGLLKGLAIIKPENNRAAFKNRVYELSPGALVENLKFSGNEKLMTAIINKISSTKSINPFITNANKSGINEKIKADTDLCDKIIYKFLEIEDYSKPELLAKISKILNAFLENRRLKFIYSQPKNFIEKLIPLRIVNYNGMWYVFGISRFGGYRYYKICRIKELETIDKFDGSILLGFKDAILNENFGIGTGGQSLVAVIKFTGRAAQTIEEVKWLEDQEIINSETGNSKIMKIKYSSNLPQELVSKLLQYGAEAEILEPEELRNEWKKRIIEMYKKIMPNN